MIEGILVALALNGLRCADAVAAELVFQRADVAGAHADPPDPSGTRRWNLPTATFGAWLRLTADAGGEAEVERVTATALTTTTFDASCRRRVEPAVALPAPTAGRFTDAALAALMAAPRGTAILVWSPHMPLSVDQYGELAAAAAALDLDTLAVLDPTADESYARQVARERGMPASALGRAASIELAFRDMMTHAPSVLVVANGRIAGPALRGYRPRDVMRISLARVMAAPVAAKGQ